jgi:hypothetical protein
MLRARPTLLAALLTALVLAVAGCGDDEDGGDGGGAYSPATEQTETSATTETAPATETEPGDDAGNGGGITAPSPSGSPEDQQGGAGDEVPASSQALITGRDGGFHPTVVRVPPFFAIRVVLRSADGVEYELEGGGRTVKAGGEIESASTTFEGLKSGERLVLSGPQGKVVIRADAEPGP